MTNNEIIAALDEAKKRVEEEQRDTILRKLDEITETIKRIEAMQQPRWYWNGSWWPTNPTWTGRTNTLDCSGYAYNGTEGV